MRTAPNPPPAQRDAAHYDFMKKRYSITSSAFEGELTFAYDESDVLTGFFNAATMNEQQIVWLATHFPMTVSLLEQVAGMSSTLTIRLTTQEVTFQEFWDAYNYKVDRKDAEKAWDKLTLAEKITAFERIPSYNYFLMTRRNQERMYPATYLRGKYDNDYKALAKATTVG